MFGRTAIAARPLRQLRVAGSTTLQGARRHTTTSSGNGKPTTSSGNGKPIRKKLAVETEDIGEVKAVYDELGLPLPRARKHMPDLNTDTLKYAFGAVATFGGIYYFNENFRDKVNGFVSTCVEDVVFVYKGIFTPEEEDDDDDEDGDGDDGDDEKGGADGGKSDKKKKGEEEDEEEDEDSASARAKKAAKLAKKRAAVEESLLTARAAVRVNELEILRCRGRIRQEYGWNVSQDIEDRKRYLKEQNLKDAWKYVTIMNEQEFSILWEHNCKGREREEQKKLARVLLDGVFMESNKDDNDSALIKKMCEKIVNS